MQNSCCICLQFIPELTPSTKEERSITNLIVKLTFCVPEIKWFPHYLICRLCSGELETAYRFRKTCFDSEYKRQEQNNDPKAEIEVSSKSEEVSKVEEAESTTNIEVGDELESDTDSDSDVAYKPEVKKPKRKTLEYTCPQCSFVATNRRTLINHATEEHKMQARDVKPYSCNLCIKRFVSAALLNQHLKYHAGKRTEICSYCGKGFITKSDLILHEKKHLNKREYTCEQCMKCFNTHKDLRSHKYVVHTDPSVWKHVCEICKKRFPLKTNYTTHMRRHTGEKNFKCHICAKSFVDKCILVRHLTSHSNVRKYKCSECSKEYKEKRVMEIHMAKIHGIGDIKVPEKVKKYFCHICPKSYFAKNKLTRHLCTHTGERPYACSMCNKTFTDSSYVKQHMKNAHNIEPASSNA